MWLKYCWKLLNPADSAKAISAKQLSKYYFFEDSCDSQSDMMVFCHKSMLEVISKLEWRW